MGEGTSFPSGEDDEAVTPDWRVDADASRARLSDPADDAPGGKLVYTDEQGRQRRLPADMSELSSGEAAAAARALSYELGAVEPSYAQIVALERLSELHASGAFSDEDYDREKRRLLGRD